MLEAEEAKSQKKKENLEDSDGSCGCIKELSLLFNGGSVFVE